jgi:hypothetical protein
MISTLSDFHSTAGRHLASVDCRRGGRSLTPAAGSKPNTAAQSTTIDVLLQGTEKERD